jgi:glyoxylase-like metal-dependent hydrolase (beta-lactamase superfamily II)
MSSTETLAVETFPIGSLSCNCSLVYDTLTREALVVDPGDDAVELIAQVRKRELQVTSLLHTHAHFDHIGGSNAVKAELGAPMLLHRDDVELYRQLRQQGLMFGFPVAPPGELDQLIEEGFEVQLGERSLLTTIHTPGHTPGSCCFYTEIAGEPLLFSGDTLFYRSVGRTDLPGGDPDALIRSIKERLFPLPEESYVVPGHGETTTLAAERRSNPFVAS